MRDKTLKLKRIIAIVSLILVLAIFGFLAYFAVYKFFAFDTGEGFAEFIASYGIWGRFVALGIQFLQVFIAFIPGEFVEVGLGFAFGAVEGTVICLLGVGLASALVFLLVKKWGVRVVELFVSTDKINSLRIINSEKKLNNLVFILFLIPGTPKDVLTYIVPLTRMKMSQFIVSSMIARIPSVVSSTIGGNMFENENYLGAVILFAATGIVSILGLKAYSVILDKYHKRKEKKEEQ